MLHHIDPISASGDGRCSPRTCRDWENGDNEGSWQVWQLFLYGWGICLAWMGHLAGFILLRAIGMSVYVFNCSEQMDYKSCGNIFKGLAQTGKPELYTCSIDSSKVYPSFRSMGLLRRVQQNHSGGALRDSCPSQVHPGWDQRGDSNIWLHGRGESYKVFFFTYTDRQVIPMNPTVGYFITMNPGYAGRAELPENLKVNSNSVLSPAAGAFPTLCNVCSRPSTYQRDHAYCRRLPWS